jgi:hypothetical protein
VNVQGFRDLLHLNLGKLAQPHCAELELDTVAMNPGKLLGAGHFDTSILLGRDVN